MTTITSHRVPQFRNTLNNFSSPSPSSSAPKLNPALSTTNTLSCTCSVSHTQLCTNQPAPSQREVEDAVSSLQEWVLTSNSLSSFYFLPTSLLLLDAPLKIIGLNCSYCCGKEYFNFNFTALVNQCSMLSRGCNISRYS